MIIRPLRHPALLLGLGLAALLAGCARSGDIDETGGIVQVRSACPTAAIPAYTGDITLFDPPTSSDGNAVDVVATITGLRATCDSAGEKLVTSATFTVNATRARPGPARVVTLPYFSVVVRGSNAVVAKRVGQVQLSFAEGQTRASASARAASYVDKSAATLPPEIEARITRKRKAGDQDAALDPMARADVREAIARTSFELLVGFNLTQDQLRYNATR